MKKILILALLLAGAAGATFYFTRLAAPVGSDYYADYLPADTLVTASLLDLNGLTDSFPASGLGRFLAKPTMHGIMTELGAAAEDLQSYDELYNGLAGIMTNPAFRQVFGDDAVAALLSPDLTRLQADPELELQQSFIVFGTSSVAGPLDTFARLVMSKDFSNETVDGLEMTRIQLDENEVVYGYADDGVLVISYDSNNIVAAVKQKQTGGGLRESADFAASKKFWSESAAGRICCQAFVNMAQFRTLLVLSEEQEAGNAAAYLQGFHSLGAVVVEQQGELHIATRAEYDFSSLHELIKQQYQSVAQENLSLDLLTGNTLAYYWSSSFDKNFVKGVLSAADEEQYKQADARIQEELGLSLEQLMAAVGPQAGLTVNEIVNAGLFPLPKVILFLQIQDRKVAQQVLDTLRSKIGDQGFVSEKSEQVNGHTLYYWTMLPGEATHPAMVLTDNMLYIANGEATLKALLAGERQPTALPAVMADTLGNELATQITNSNYSTFVMRPAQLAIKVKEAADWLAGMFAAPKGITTDALRLELFNLMQTIDVVAATGDIQQDHAVSTLVFKQVAGVKQDHK